MKKNLVLSLLVFVIVAGQINSACAVTYLTSCGTLSSAGETYVLSNDVSSDNSCFLIAADNVTLDLNGHIVTYAINGNSIPTFEVGGTPYNCLTYNGFRLGNYCHYGVYADVDPRRMPDAKDLIGWQWNLNPRNFILKNGIIRQGTSATASGDAVHVSSNNSQYFNLHIEVSGPDSQNIDTINANNNVSIYQNTLISNSTFVENRHQGRAVIVAFKGSVHDNVIRGGPQYGIRIKCDSWDYCSPGYDGADVYNNDIRHKTTAGNGYAIGAYADNMDVYNNTIDTTGEYSGRGIHVSMKNINIYNNTLRVSERPNSEYPSYWVHGIKLEGNTNSKIHDNDVTVYSLSNSDGRALDLSEGENAAGEIYDNVFRAVAGPGTLMATTIQMTSSPQNTTTVIRNNRFFSNSVHFYGYAYGGGYQFRSNTFRVEGTPVSYSTLFLANNNNMSGNVLLDNIFENGASLDNVSLRGYCQGATCGVFEFYIKWYLDLTVRDQSGNPVTGASVTASATGTFGETVTAATDSQGKARLVLTQKRWYNTADDLRNSKYDYYTPHIITASFGGQSASATVNMTSSRELTLQLGNVPYIQMTKSVDKANAVKNDNLTYTIIYQNTGSAIASNVVISDTVPVNTTYIANSATNDGQFDGTNVVWNLGNIASGASGSVSFMVKTV